MSKTLSDRESDIMQVLWDLGPCRVRDVRRHPKDPLAHNTVLTMLGILEEKGFLRREAVGRGHRYFLDPFGLIVGVGAFPQSN